jgi:hypothetical protein
MSTTLKLTLVSEQEHGRQLYRVSGVGTTPQFWPHDGDLITMNDAKQISEKRGWRLEVLR